MPIATLLYSVDTKAERASGSSIRLKPLSPGKVTLLSQQGANGFLEIGVSDPALIEAIPFSDHVEITISVVTPDSSGPAGPASK